MSTDLSLKEIQKEWHGSLKAYVIGFFASLILTLISFSLVYTQWISGYTLIYTLIGLGVVQAIVQLIFFLHVGQEDKPRWETFTFAFMVLVLLIIIIGSLWIMNDLDHRVMPDMAKEMAHD
jgi:cytochrome o ubiquinol oxidase operon protein cyoD